METRTLADLFTEPTRKAWISDKAVGVVHSVANLQKNWAGRGNNRREVFIVDSSEGGQCAKTFLWGERAEKLGAWLFDEVKKGSMPILALSPIELSYIERGQLGTKQDIDQQDLWTDPPCPLTSEYGGPLAEPFQDAALCKELRDWYSGAGVEEECKELMAGRKRAIRNAPPKNPKKGGAAAGAGTGKKRAAAGGAGGSKTKKKKAGD